MPPRYAYWTILVDNLPTAFRAREREELRPTFERLKQKHPDAVMRWFSQGQLWDSPEAAAAARAAARAGTRLPSDRGRDWRPGGSHRDPRDRFKEQRKKRRAALDEQRVAGAAEFLERKRGPRRDRDGTERAPTDRERRPDRDRRPRQGLDDGAWRQREGRQPRAGDRPRDAWRDKPQGGAHPPRDDRARRDDRRPAGRDRRRDAPPVTPGGGLPSGDRNTRRSDEHRGSRPKGGPPRGGSPRENWRDPSARGERRDERRDREERRDRQARDRRPPHPKAERREDKPGRGNREGVPEPPPPGPPPGPDRPPKPGQEPPSVPTRTEEIVIPRVPPERGRAVIGPGGARLVKPRTKR